MTIMERIEKLCADRKWTLYELSTRANISMCTLYSCKNNKREPTNETLRKVCAVFGISIYEFYHDFYENPELTDDQIEIISRWILLEPNEKEIIKNTADAFISKRKQTIS